MCNFFSCIVTKGWKALWSKRSMSHEDIIKEYELNDKRTDFMNLPFVRVEIIPKNPKKVTRDREDWVLKVDEPQPPDWYILDPEKYNAEAWHVWSESIKVNLALDKEEVKVQDNYLEAYGSATVYASGSATVKAYGSATVYASGSATVEAYDSAKVEAYDSATVEAYDSAKVKAYGSATVYAYDSAKVKAYGSATVYAYDSAKVEAYDSAKVEAYDTAKVKAYDTATVYAYDTAKVEAYDTATVKAYGSATVRLQSNYAILRQNDTIYVKTLQTVKEMP